MAGLASGPGSLPSDWQFDWPAQGAETSIYLASSQDVEASAASSSLIASPEPQTGSPTTPTWRAGYGKSALTWSAWLRWQP